MFYIFVPGLIFTPHIAKFGVEGKLESLCPPVFLSVFLRIFWTVQPFVTRCGMVMHFYEAECHVKKLGCFLQGQGYNAYIIKIWLWLYLLNDEILLQLNLVWW